VNQHCNECHQKGHSYLTCPQRLSQQARQKALAARLLEDCGLTRDQVLRIRYDIRSGFARTPLVEAVVSEVKPRTGPWKLKDDLS
jgi:hypothetical protein